MDYEANSRLSDTVRERLLVYLLPVYFCSAHIWNQTLKDTMVNDGSVIRNDLVCLETTALLPGPRERLSLSIWTVQEYEINGLHIEKGLADSCVIEPPIICAFPPDPRLHLYFTVTSLPARLLRDYEKKTKGPASTCALQEQLRRGLPAWEDSHAWP